MCSQPWKKSLSTGGSGRITARRSLVNEMSRACSLLSLGRVAKFGRHLLLDSRDRMLSFGYARGFNVADNCVFRRAPLWASTEYLLGVLMQ